MDAQFALNTLNNYINEVFMVEADFPDFEAHLTVYPVSVQEIMENPCDPPSIPGSVRAPSARQNPNTRSVRASLGGVYCDCQDPRF